MCFRKWWAQAEANHPIGLSARCLFSFASALPPSDPSLAGFMDEVASPLISNVFESVLRLLGPDVPVTETSALWTWPLSEKAERVVYKVRTVCHDLAVHGGASPTMASSLTKTPYWIAQVALHCSILSQTLPAALDDAHLGVLSATVPDAAVCTALNFTWLRFVGGMVVLDHEIKSKSWERHCRRAASPLVSLDRRVVKVLLASASSVFLPEQLRELDPLFREGTSSKHDAYVRKVFLRMQELGFGNVEDVGGSLRFVKYSGTELGHAALKRLREMAVPLWLFSGFELCQPGLHDDETVGMADAVDPPSVCEVSDAQGEGGAVAKLSDGEAQSEDDVRDCVTLFEGPPSSVICSYSALRAEVEKALARLKDPGVLAFKDRGVSQSTRRLRATCRTDACTGCTRRVYASLVTTPGGTTLRIRARGEHGQLQPPKGGHLWNVSEAVAIREMCPEASRISVKMVRQALHTAGGLKLRCSSVQLNNFVTRWNKSCTSTTGKKDLTCAEILAAAEAYRKSEDVRWSTCSLEQLLIVRPPVVEDRVCVIWSCRGMLEKLRAAKGKALKLVVDGKQRVLTHSYKIVTLSFVVRKDQVSRTWAGPQRGVRVEAHTGTQQPFLQAMVDEESTPNMVDIFRTACELAKELHGIELQKQVLQVHKDWAKGILAAKREVFAGARVCEDYAHLRRASYSTLQKHVATAAGPNAKARAKAKANTAGRGAGRPAAMDSPHFEEINNMVSSTRLLPTLQLFDAVWHVFSGGWRNSRNLRQRRTSRIRTSCWLACQTCRSISTWVQRLGASPICSSQVSGVASWGHTLGQALGARQLKAFMQIGSAD